MNMSDMLDVSSSTSSSTYTTSIDKDTYTGALIGTLSSGSNTLTTEDFYQLMAVQIQNQTIDDTYDTSQFLTQMVQMAVIDAIDTMTTVSTTQYAASMVGKEVTVGVVDAAGNVEEIVGEVTATGVLNGVQVIFVNDVAYTLSQIMAIGRLPETSEDTEDGDEDDTTVDGVDPEDALDGTDTEYDGADGTDTDVDTDLEYDGADGTDDDIIVDGTTDTDTEYDGTDGTNTDVDTDLEYDGADGTDDDIIVDGTTGTDTDFNDTLDGSEGTTGGLVDDVPDENNDGESTDDTVVEVPATDEA